MKRERTLVLKRFLVLLLSGGILLLLTTCRKDIGGPEPCFQKEILPVFISSCTAGGCHNAGDKAAGYDLSSYEGILRGIKPKHPLQSKIYNAIKGSNPSMPKRPFSKLSSLDVSNIKLWINMGAKNTSDCATCDTANFTYSGRVKNVLQAWCTSCHNSENSGGGFDLSSYAGVVSAVANNNLMGSIKHASGFVPMPQTGGQMDQCEIDAIQKWVNAGYLNN